MESFAHSAVNLCALYVLAECVHVLARATRKAAVAIAARVAALCERHVVILAAPGDDDDDDESTWDVESILGLVPRIYAGDTALGLLTLVQLIRTSRAQHLRPAVNIHIVVPATTGRIAALNYLGNSAGDNVRVHVYRTEPNDGGSGGPGTRLHCETEGPLTREAYTPPWKHVDLLVVYSGTHLTDATLNAVVGTRTVELAVVLSRGERLPGRGGAGEEEQEDQEEEQEDMRDTCLPIGWLQYLLQTARETHLFSPARNNSAHFPARCRIPTGAYLGAGASRSNPRAGSRSHSADQVARRGPSEAPEEELGEEERQGGNDDSQQQLAMCRSVAIMAFAATMWYRRLRPWWEVALREVDSPLDMVSGCFYTRAATPGFAGVRRAVAHEYSRIGECVLALARNGWVRQRGEGGGWRG